MRKTRDRAPQVAFQLLIADERRALAKPGEFLRRIGCAVTKDFPAPVTWPPRKNVLIRSSPSGLRGLSTILRGPLWRAILMRMLGHGRTLGLSDFFRDRPTHEIMGTMTRLVARDVKVRRLDHIPRRGPALIVANQPTGTADGTILHQVISPLRQDAIYCANSDILQVLPRMQDMIVPVECRQDRRTHDTILETMARMRGAIEAGRIGGMFPSGRLAKRRGQKLYERKWMASAAMIARKHDLPVIPVNIRARNSALFCPFDRIHPTLRDITLLHETLNKVRQPFGVKTGEPSSARALPTNSEDGIEMLHIATLALGGCYAPDVSIAEMTRCPVWAKRLST